MADSRWKERVGIDINFSSGDEDDDDSSSTLHFNDEPDFVGSLGGSNSQDLEEAFRVSSVDDVLSQYEQYGSTPPRTRIKNKNRSSRQRMEGNVRMRTGGRLARPRADRRNTVDCAILNQLIMEPNSGDEKARGDKRSTQLLRESERDSKMAAAVNTVIARNSANFGITPGSIEERAESMPIPSLTSGIPQAVVESCNRFMSVKSRPVGCRTSAPPSAFANFRDSVHISKSDIPQNRIAFHDTFSNLIKLGSIDKDRTTKNIISTEERLWQTHVNDLLWLELQAWHADRSVEQQDKILCQARNEIDCLLNEIMNFRFQRQLARTVSDISMADSGFGSDATASTANGEVNKPFCFGCLSMYCKDCLEIQTIALKQVEDLLLRLESKESLFPSSKAMGAAYPIYQSEAFVGRVKAMCLWYNMTKQHRLTLLILGKLLARLQGNKKTYHWPIMETDSSTSSSVQEENGEAVDSGQGDSSTTSSVNSTTTAKRVQFMDEAGSATESANSDESGQDMSEINDDYSIRKHYAFTGDTEMSQYMNTLNFYSVNSITEVTSHTANNSTALYRKYIENVLKCRGLGKSLTFLHRLHNVVLRKAQLTLEKPGMHSHDDDSLFIEEDVPCIEPPLEKEQESELRRFGAASKEAKELNLPSYVPAFIFLSLIPLEVIQEFLKMRLETRPVQPNPLSLEQHIKELKEGLTLAMIHRDRFEKHINTALFDRESELERYITVLETFDGTVKRIFELYLDYAEQWILVATPECQQKSALDEEWRFTKLICPMIPGQHAIAAKGFCKIVEKVLENTGRKMFTSLRELEDQIKQIDSSDIDRGGKKWQFLALCRETQNVFTFAREKTMKTMAFTKALFRDLESSDFHRDHCDECEEGLEEECVVLRKPPASHVCQEVVEVLRMLKKNVLLFRNKLTLVIENLQEECHVRNMADMDESDRIAVLTRTREILHQGYKFGFEFHKDLSRLYESKAEVCRDMEGELKLSNAIVHFAKLWMKFVMERCERGRGLRPRWANQGLEFLISACDPHCTSHLSDTEFEDLKTKMDACISHVIGSIRDPERLRRSPRSRKSSPSPSPSQGRASIPSITLNKTFQNQLSLREEGVTLRAHHLVDANDIYRKQSSYEGAVHEVKIRVPTGDTLFGTKPLRQLRVRDAINRLDTELEERLRERSLIGSVKEISYCDKALNRARSVNFSWHRGIKIGQGRFGKVYTAVNNSTGELMAMKEIAIQPGETSAIRKVAEELKIFEGINHRNLVKYYGVEVHREELLIFMELCPEGTLESLVELNGGLPEGQTRRYTMQLLSGVKELHRHGVVHRDIKTANIFLTSDGNFLKLGDFGSAVKIQAHTTLPGELKGYVGTQAYMAPEVFTKTNSEGHGRAADIWSVGCVVIEVCSGKRPWHQFDSNFQIMFKVGMGESPEIPDCLSEEGHDFVESCLQHDPKVRKSAGELLHHNFCKVSDDSPTLVLDKQIRTSFRRHLNSSASSIKSTAK